MQPVYYCSYFQHLLKLHLTHFVDLYHPADLKKITALQTIILTINLGLSDCEILLLSRCWDSTHYDNHHNVTILPAYIRTRMFV